MVQTQQSGASRIDIKNKKNKISIPFRECGFELTFKDGINPYYGVLPFLVEDGVVTKPGNKYVIGETKFWEKEFDSLLKDYKNKDFDTIRELFGINKETENVGE